MAGRIKTVRSLLYDDLVKLNPDKDWTFVNRQIGRAGQVDHALTPD